MISTPLAGRFHILNISPSNVDKWAEWMNRKGEGYAPSSRKHGDKWDKTVYIFHKRFEDEGLFLKLPKENETLSQYSNPYSNEMLAIDLYEGFRDRDTIIGWLGEEVGQKFIAFMKTKVDIEQLLAQPELFKPLDLDAKYMLTMMLATWISKRLKGKNPEKALLPAFKLIDVMCKETRDYLVTMCMVMSHSKLIDFLQLLFKYDAKYGDILEKITRIVKAELA